MDKRIELERDIDVSKAMIEECLKSLRKEVVLKELKLSIEYLSSELEHKKFILNWLVRRK